MSLRVIDNKDNTFSIGGPWGSVGSFDTPNDAMTWGKKALMRFNARVSLFNKGLIRDIQV